MATERGETSREMNDRHVRETRREAMIFAVVGALVMGFGMIMGQLWPLDWVYALSGMVSFMGGSGIGIGAWLFWEARQMRIDQDRHEQRMAGLL